MVNPTCKKCGRWIGRSHKCPEDGWNGGEKNPMYGKKHSKETKEKWSKLRKNVPKSEETKKKMSSSWDYNKHIIPEIIAKMRNTKKGKCLGKDNPNYDNKWGDKQKKIASIRMMGKKNPKLSIMNHKRYVEGKNVFPKKDSSIEVKIQNLLTQLHIEYFTHKYMKIEHGYQCDILIPTQNGISQKIIIECDGCYWHGCPVCNNKPHKNLKLQKERDKRRTQELQEKGYRVIRIWEHDIKVIELNDLKNEL